MPTVEQALACVRVCQMLSTCYRPIHLFRYDERREIVYILAGETEDIEIVVPVSGQWRFVK